MINKGFSEGLDCMRNILFFKLCAGYLDACYSILSIFYSNAQESVTASEIFNSSFPGSLVHRTSNYNSLCDPGPVISAP